MTKKQNLLILGLTVWVASGVIGCKKEEPAGGSALSTSSDAGKAVDAAKETAQETADKAKTQATALTDKAKGEAAALQEQAQSLIDKTKALIGEQKYQEALTSLGQLANAKLTPDQQKLVADLKTQIQSALAKAAGK